MDSNLLQPYQVVIEGRTWTISHNSEFFVDEWRLIHDGTHKYTVLDYGTHVVVFDEHDGHTVAHQFTNIRPAVRGVNSIAH